MKKDNVKQNARKTVSKAVVILMLLVIIASYVAQLMYGI